MLFCLTLYAASITGFFVSNVGAEEVTKSESQSQIFDFTLFGERTTELMPLELSHVIPGMEKHATVFIQNRCIDSIEFVDVEVGCKCTQARVPKKTLLPNETCQLDFKFAVPSIPATLRETYDVTLRTRGVRETIRVRFTAELENAVVFGKSDYVHRFNQNTPVVSFAIPLLVSSPDLLEGLQVEASETLSFATLKIEIENDLPMVRGRFFSKSVDNSSVMGEIRINRDGKMISSILCTLHKEKEMEILPNPIVFVPNEVDPTRRDAVGIVRIRTNSKNDVKLIRDIEAKAGLNTKVVANVTRITDEMYRLRLELDMKSIDEEVKSIFVRLRTSDGIESTFNLSCLFSN